MRYTPSVTLPDRGANMTNDCQYTLAATDSVVASQPGGGQTDVTLTFANAATNPTHRITVVIPHALAETLLNSLQATLNQPPPNNPFIPPGLAGSRNPFRGPMQRPKTPPKGGTKS